MRSKERERERDNTRSANQSHAAPDNQATTIPHHCDHLSFLPWSLSSFLFRPSPLAPAPLSFLYLSIFRSRSSLSLFSSSRPRDASSPFPRHSSLPLSRSFASHSRIYLSVSHILSFAFLVPRRSRTSLRRRLARASIEPAEHRPILHLNLVNLPELANELRAWCLILAHEHGRRYTASNTSGEGTRVQSFAKVADNDVESNLR